VVVPLFSKSWRWLLEALFLLGPVNDALLSVSLFNFSVVRSRFPGTGNFWVNYRAAFGRSNFRFHRDFASIFFWSTSQALLLRLLRFLCALSGKVFWWLRLKKTSKPSKFVSWNKFAKICMSIPDMQDSEKIGAEGLFALNTLVSNLMSVWIEHFLD